MSKRGRLPSQRQLRVGEEIRHALAAIIGRGELRDPELSGISITVSEVRASPDLKRATAFVVPLGDDDPAAILEPLRRAGPFLRRRIAATLSLKYAPDIRFEADTSFDHARQIDELMGAHRSN